MKVIVDTDIWSEALRKKIHRKSKYIAELIDLINESRVQMLGPIRMEVLCGIREIQKFEKLKLAISKYPDGRLNEPVFVAAASMFNSCRSKGIQGSKTDFIICAYSVLHKMAIFTKNKDFIHYQKHLPIELHHSKN